MRMYDLIENKKKGMALTKEEISYMVKGFVNGEIPDYQMSAMLMAIYFQGMNDQEITYLTLEMAHSGDTVDLSPIEGIKVDKHSTGGVGDKTTLVVGPVVASLGVKAVSYTHLVPVKPLAFCVKRIFVFVKNVKFAVQDE